MPICPDPRPLPPLALWHELEFRELPAPGVVPNLNHPRNVLRTVTFVVQGLCLITALMFVALRMYTRVMIQKSKFEEDYRCLASLAAVVCGIYCRQYPSIVGLFGGGYNVWEVSKSEVENFLKVNYGGLLFYGPEVCLIKLTLLIFTARLLATTHRSTIAVNIFIFITLGFYIPMQFAKNFVCKPIPTYWDRVSHPNSTCLDMRVIYVADTIKSSITDLAVLVLPIPLVWGMKVRPAKKLKALGLLAPGGIANGASITRMVFVRQIWETHNETLYGAAFDCFGAAETSIGLICACLPSMSLFLAHYGQDNSQSVDYPSLILSWP